jgi:hypothetical protein
MDTQQIEKLVEIAKRIPPGDTWKLLANNQVYSSLTEVLNAYYVIATVKPNAFRLEPMKGVCYIITNQEIPKPEPKKFDLYGDFE